MFLQMARFHFNGGIILHCMYLYVCVRTHTQAHTIFSIYSLINGHLGCFQVLAIGNNPVVHIYLFKLVFSLSLDKYLIVKQLDHTVSSTFNFLRSLHTVSTVAAPVCIPTSSAWGFLSLHIHSNTCYFSSLWSQPFWQMWGDTSRLFWFAFPWRWIMLSIFSRICWPSRCPLWRNVYSDPLPIFF